MKDIKDIRNTRWCMFSCDSHIEELIKRQGSGFPMDEYSHIHLLNLNGNSKEAPADKLSEICEEQIILFRKGPSVDILYTEKGMTEGLSKGLSLLKTVPYSSKMKFFFENVAKPKETPVEVSIPICYFTH